MTALAVAEAEIAAEVPPAVVTGRTGLTASGVEMLGRIGGTDLSRLRGAGGDFVTVCAGESLSRAVVRVTESVTKRARIGAGRTIRFLIVTDTARADLAACV